MKAKKILFAMFALVCVLAVSVSFSSCSKDDPGGDEKIKSNCDKAASQLNNMAFEGSYTYVVTKFTSKGSSTVYSWTNPSN